jgi:uncharacterized protein YndB with AHSA1/START domain
MTSFDPGPLAPVTVHRDGDRWTLVFVREFPQAPALVWAALTDPQQLAAWAPFEADRPLDRTGPATLTMIDGDTRQPLAATVRRSEPPHLLEYAWGTDELRWELTPSGTGTRLTLSHTVPDQSWLSKVAAGWHLCLAVAQRMLDGDPVTVIRGGDAMNYGWADLDVAYRKVLDLPAAE